MKRLARPVATILFTVGIALVGVPSGAAVRPAAASAHIVTSYQIDSSHDGISSDPVTGPWHLAWSQHFRGFVTYPVIANGLVVVAIDSTPGVVEAFRTSNGARAWGPVTFRGTPGLLGLALDGSTLFVLGPSPTHVDESTVTAVSETTGIVRWTVAVGGATNSFSPPVAYKGEVFVASSAKHGATLAAISERTHRVVWRRTASSGPGGALAADAVGVFYSFSCGTAGALTRGGRTLWRTIPSCNGRGGTTPVVAGTSIYLRISSTGGWILNRSTGTFLNNYLTTTLPLVVGNVMYTTSAGSLDASNLVTGASPFTFSPGPCLGGPALDVNHVIYVLTACAGGGSKDAILYGVSSTGAQMSSVHIPIIQKMAPAPSQAAESMKLQGMAEGDGVFVIPGGDRLEVLKPHAG